MSFYIFPSNGLIQYATFEQLPGFYSSINSIYQSNEDFFNPSHLTYSMTFNDPYQKSEQKYGSTLSTIDELPKKTPITPIVRTQRSKRRSEKTIQKEISSAKKNSESNIINQFYSHFSCREKSEKIVEKCAIIMEKSKEQIQKILPIFYTTIRLINMKRGRKYVNVAMFIKFFNPQQFSQYVAEIKDKIQESGCLTLQQLCQIFRRCAKYFLKQVSLTSILTSKRISLVSKQQHLKKSRKILKSILCN